MNRKNIEDLYPLTPLQQGMVFHSLADPESGAYVEQTSCLLDGQLDAEAFERAWQQVMQRHPILRTAFIGEGQKELAQVVFRQLELPFTLLDWSNLPIDERQQRCEQYLYEDRQYGFTLSQAPLFRLTLIQEGVRRHRFVWTYHHALLDGWSGPLLFQEVFALYDAYRRGKKPMLPQPRPYRDYIAWLRKQSLTEAEAFWRQNLAGFHAPTPLVVEKTAHSSATYFAEQHIDLPAEDFAELQALARTYGLTMNTLTQGAWALLLSRYSSEDDVLFGATVAGRPTELTGVETMIGLFINTLPVRVTVPSDGSCAAWLQELQTRQAELRRYEYTPLVQIHGWSNVPRDQALFETLLVFENYPMDMTAAAEDGDLVIGELESVEQTNYPLNLVAGVANTLTLKISYDAERFDAATIERMLGHLATLLRGFAATPDAPPATLPILTAAEHKLILDEWNAAARPFPADRCIQEMFAGQAARTPDAIAVRFAGADLSYAELNRQANRLAHYLRRHGVGPETLVGICTERSFDMIIAILGVLKAGGAYVPLDPTYPSERLSFMLRDAGVRLLLAHAAVGDVLDALAAEASTTGIELQIIALDDDQPLIAGEPEHEPPLETTPENLAYVIYTSGSTGRPKGALLEHRGLVNLIHIYIDDMDISPDDKVLQFFAFGFDGSVLDIFAALLSGATLCLLPREATLPGEEMAQILHDEAITMTMLPPSVLATLPDGDYPDLRIIVSGGEACTREIVARWAPGRRFYNGYGPTEATVATTWHLIDPKLASERIPLGHPIANMQFYILDQRQQPVPIGVPGELCIGGVGLARGYHNRPDLTAEKFIANPFAPEISARLYRSGDLVRYREDGMLDFLGRIDHQVKLRGFRIELGEIETVLTRHPAVRQAVVLLREDVVGEPRLVAYYALADTDAGETDLVPELRSFLRERLPAYMVPARFMLLNAFPLTPNGKIDRRGLPAPDQVGGSEPREYVAPRNERERTLVAIWEEVLGQTPIGVADNFFDLGGHSLLAIRASALIEQKTGRRASLQLLYRQPTIAELAVALDTATGDDPAATIVPIQPGNQRRPLFFIHPSGGSVHWYHDLARHLGPNQPFYGLQARGIEGDAPLHNDIEAMATYYTAAIRSVQPHGPYLLGSWSLGVILAYAVAHTLETQGEQVEFLAIFDQGPYPPGEAPDDLASYLIEVFGDHIPLNPADLQNHESNEQIAHVLHEGQRTGWIYREVSFGQFSRFVEILRTHKLAWHHYAPPAYNGRITLFRAMDGAHDQHNNNGRIQTRGGPLNRLLAGLNLARRKPETHAAADDLDAMGWDELARGGVDVIPVPGDHITMLMEPHVKTLAEQLRARLDQAGTAS